MRRVTRPGGRVLTLDIVRPGVPVWASLFALYFHRVVPAIGALVAGDRSAYTYLPDSVERFVTPAELARAMTRAGLRDVGYRHLALGTIAVHTATA
jgi:demethylmenaquinone methyltransferase/2-methoxy-6-polyprenyl-1,4-benzoquinol methylase